METFVKYVLPYIVTLLTAAISGLITYMSAIKRSKMDNDIRIKEIQEQHRSDLEKQKENFRLEIEKINLQHRNELEKLNVEGNNRLTDNLANTFVSLLNNPKNLSDLMDLKDKLDKEKK